MDTRRDPRETRDLTIRRLKEDYEKKNRTVISSAKLREIEKYAEKITKQVYEGK